MMAYLQELFFYPPREYFRVLSYDLAAPLGTTDEARVLLFSPIPH